MTTKSAPLTRIRVVIPFLLYYAEKGGDPADILVETGCDPDLMSKPDGVITSNAIHSIVNAIGERLNDDFIGARVGEGWAFSDDPPFASAKANSKFLGQLFSSLIAEFSNESAAGGYTITVDQSFAVFQGGRSFTPEYPTQQPDATFASFLVSLLRRWMGPSWNPISVVLLVEDPSSIPHWLIPASSVLAGPKNKVSLRFPAAWLNVERGADLTSRGVEHHSDSIQADRLQAARKFVAEHLNAPDIQIEKAAKYCGLGVRALQRLLKANGTSFRRLVSTTRIEAASQKLKQSDAPIAEIAQSIGFTSSSSFAKAFRKVNGISPEAYRRSQKG